MKIDKGFKFYIGIAVVIVLYNLLIVDSLLKMVGINQDYDTFFSLEPTEIFASVAIAPILEEVLFRTHLSYQKKHFFGILLMLLTNGVVFYEISPIISALCAFLFLLILFFYDTSVQIILLGNKRFTFMGTAIIFSFFHYSYLAQYDFSVVMNLIILLISYLPIGLFLGYVRGNLGLVASMIAHALFNILILTGNTFIY